MLSHLVVASEWRGSSEWAIPYLETQSSALATQSLIAMDYAIEDGKMSLSECECKGFHIGEKVKDMEGKALS